MEHFRDYSNVDHCRGYAYDNHENGESRMMMVVEEDIAQIQPQSIFHSLLSFHSHKVIKEVVLVGTMQYPNG